MVPDKNVSLITQIKTTPPPGGRRRGEGGSDEDQLSPDDFADDFDQLGRVKRLDQPAGGAGGPAKLFHLVAVFLGQDEDGYGLELGVLAQPLC